MTNNCWNPEQYLKFEKERNQPFYDLLELIQPYPNMRIVDLGCGTGNLTVKLHKKFSASDTLGIDSSEEMLRESLKIHEPNLNFQSGDVASFVKFGKFNLIFSNACLQWVPGHEELFLQFVEYLTEHGQLAIQMPYNSDYPSHKIAHELAIEMRLVPAKFNVLPPEKYAVLLHRLGFKEQIVRVQVYGHVLESTKSLVEWVRGSLLTYYQKQLSPELFDKFVQEYQKRVIDYFGNHSPFFMPFKRMLIWASK